MTDYSDFYYSVRVLGTVEREFFVIAKTQAEAEVKACAEWANATGGYLKSAVCFQSDVDFNHTLRLTEALKLDEENDDD